jgi:hypothetical protein
MHPEAYTGHRAIRPERVYSEAFEKSLSACKYLLAVIDPA